MGVRGRELSVNGGVRRRPENGDVSPYCCLRCCLDGQGQRRRPVVRGPVAEAGLPRGGVGSVLLCGLIHPARDRLLSSQAILGFPHGAGRGTR